MNFFTFSSLDTLAVYIVVIFHTFAKALKLVVAIIAKIYTLHNIQINLNS